ncbi:MAG: signal peptidase I [Alphaproteobacteria bacterium]|nr:MAG: signal peptidase I [Alphaproteobacteria bacterium]
MESQKNNAPKRPILVRLSLWGVKSRRMALTFLWMCVVCGVTSALLGFWLLALYLIFVAAPMYWYSLRWVDKNDTWPLTPQSKTSMVILWVFTGAFLMLLVTRELFIGYYNIPQNGMYPGLPPNSKIFTAKRAYSNPADVKRGDIITFLREKGGRSYVYIWRVIALPGEKVETSGEALAINGQAAQRELVGEAGGEKIFRERIGDVSYEVAFNQTPSNRPPDVAITVPVGEFFVMGDNRFDALDSRSFGTVPFSAIIGRKI